MPDIVNSTLSASPFTSTSSVRTPIDSFKSLEQAILHR
jgi:hypothetical protein